MFFFIDLRLLYPFTAGWTGAWGIGKVAQIKEWVKDETERKEGRKRTPIKG